MLYPVRSSDGGMVRCGRIRLFDGILLRRGLVLTLKKNVIFRLDPATYEAVKSWYGPPGREELLFILRERSKYGILMGIAFLVVALLAGSTGRVFGTALSTNWVFGAVGACMLSLSLVARTRPHRGAFLFEVTAGLFLVALFGTWAMEGRTLLWLVLILLPLRHIVDGVRQFRRFGATVEANSGHGALDNL